MQHQETQNLEAFTLIPAGMTFKHALRAGYVKPYRNRNYLDFVKTLTCPCGAPADDPSHVNSYKGTGTKSPDVVYLAILPNLPRTVRKQTGLLETVVRG